MGNSTHFKNLLFTLLIVFLAMPAVTLAQNRQLTFEDIMKWEDITDSRISANGEWIAYSVWPDRGDGEVRVRSVDSKTIYTIELGDNPAITREGDWVAAILKVPLAEQLKEGNNKPKPGFGLLNTATGETVKMDSVRTFEFSNDGNWVAVHHSQSAEVEKIKSQNKKLGTLLVLRNLDTGAETGIPFVSSMAFDSTSGYLAYAKVDTSGEANGLYVRNLSGGDEHVVVQEENGYYDNLSWDHEGKRLAFTASKLDNEDNYKEGDADLRMWSAGSKRVQTLVASDEAGDSWKLSSTNDLEWTYDGDRLFFGLLDRELAEAGEKDEKEEDSTQTVDIYNREEILDKKSVDVWHWNDPLIKTHERDSWNQRKNHLYRAVYHLKKKKWVQLADRQMPEVDISHNDRYVLGSSNVPYRKLMTWSGFYDDYYVVDLNTGKRTLVAEKLQSGAGLSPGGNFVVYYDDKNWHLYNVRKKTRRNLTSGLDVPFYNEDHDYPSAVPGYWYAGWVEGDEAVLIYDKYDIWKFSTEDGEAVNLTQDGRERELTYRIERLDRDREAFRSREEVLLEAYYDKKKTYGFYTLQLNREGTQRRLEAPKKFEVVAKAEESDRIIYSRESYDEYPNLWVSSEIDFSETEQLTELHMNLHETYNWGTAELIEWKSLDGKDIQGAVIKPDTYQEGKKYPVLIYFYRFFSQRAYEFNNITNDDRPTLPQWVSDDYIVFLPDIRFEVGTPGFASTKSLVPGVQKLIEMGIADPDKLGLHGHSWSGYQTAFIITQTDIFDAAIAGAPVSNMTSAYSGIRWGSGLARQFQYEQTQSRIGGSLWEYPERYIENSPVFYADRIETPLLMMFGDEDTAVPWYQGIEMYLAMRRLGKDAVFLQYHNEPHHLQEYGNRLDYAIKMKEYFDHYLRGAPAPEWITRGVPYRGE